MTNCRDCAAGLDHCHGSLVVHVDGRFECAECTTPIPSTHELRVECTAPCCIAVPASLPLAA